MSNPANDDEAREAALMDAYIRHHFGVGERDQTSAPAATEAGASEEDKLFDAYMQQHFPATAKR